MDSVSKPKGIPYPKSAPNAKDRNPHKSPRSRQVSKQNAASHSNDDKDSSGREGVMEPRL